MTATAEQKNTSAMKLINAKTGAITDAEEMMTTEELPKVESVTIHQSGDVYLKDQALMEEMLQQLADYRKRNEALQAEVDRLNKSALENSVLHQQLKTQNTVITGYLRTWVQIFESKFDSDEDQELTEALDYITHAAWLKVTCQREDYGMIRRVREWYDNQPAWKQKPATL